MPGRPCVRMERSKRRSVLGAGECANINCRTLALGQTGFQCSECTLVAGSVVCTAGASYPVSGYCDISPCQDSCTEASV